MQLKRCRAEPASDIDDLHESASSSDDDCADATAELARWCRQQRREGGASATTCERALQTARHNPQRALQTLGSSDDGRAFLLSLVRRRQCELSAATEAPRRAARAHAALGSLRECLGELGPAISHVAAAARLRGALPAAPLRDATLAEELRRSLSCVAAGGRGGGGELLSHLARLLRQREQEEALARLLRASLVAPPPPLPLPRAPAGLSVSAFWEEYASRRVPVVLPLPPGAGPAQAWDLAFLRASIGGRVPALRRRDAASTQWAGLEPATLGPPPGPEPAGAAGGQTLSASSTTMVGATTVADFIDRLDATAEEAEPAYLFDWSLPQHCKELLTRRPEGGGGEGGGGGGG